MKCESTRRQDCKSLITSSTAFSGLVCRTLSTSNDGRGGCADSNWVGSPDALTALALVRPDWRYGSAGAQKQIPEVCAGLPSSAQKLPDCFMRQHL